MKNIMTLGLIAILILSLLAGFLTVEICEADVSNGEKIHNR